MLQNTGVTTGLYDVCFVDDRNGWAVGDRGVILSTEDGGAHWTSQDSGTNMRLQSLFFIDSSRGWISGQNGTMLHTEGGGK